MKKIVLKTPDKTHFCLPYPGTSLKSKIDIIQDKEVVMFEDPDTQESFQARREDMIWYGLNEISEFHARVCTNMTAHELKRHMIRNFNLSEKDQVWILLFSKI